MTITLKHKKTNTIASWTQTELDTAIAKGYFPAGATLADIVLSSDWNDEHIIEGFEQEVINNSVAKVRQFTNLAAPIGEVFRSKNNNQTLAVKDQSHKVHYLYDDGFEIVTRDFMPDWRHRNLLLKQGAVTYVVWLPDPQEYDGKSFTFLVGEEFTINIKGKFLSGSSKSLSTIDEFLTIIALDGFWRTTSHGVF